MADVRLTAAKVASDLHDHKELHANKYDPKLHNLHIVIFGEKNDNGLVREVDELQHCYSDIDKRLTSIEGYIKWLILLVMGAIIGAGLNLVMTR